MDKSRNYAALKKFCQNQGAGLFGVADISEIKKGFSILHQTLEGLDRAVCLGIGLSCAVLSEVKTQPTRLYFHHYRTANMFLDQLAFKVSNYIENKGFLAMPIPASQILDWQKQTAHLSHKKIAVLAGLGWIGRNNLLVNKKLGSKLRLVTILTNLPLKIDSPLKKQCGWCRLCIASCPAQAIKENHSEFEHLRCFEQLKNFQKQRLTDQYICGVCVNVCRGRSNERKNINR